MMKAKQFSLSDENGEKRSLSDFRGKWVVLYFYPKDNTPGCTKEACEFRDHFNKLKEMGVVVLGISKDSSASHLKFKGKFKLPFPLLSDEEKVVIKAYKAWGKKKFLGKEFEGTLRKTYLIDPEGNMAKTYEKVNPLLHAKEIVRDIDDFQKGGGY